MWAAREAGDTAAEREIVEVILELGARLLTDEGANTDV